ncbi:MAG TPA: hypothetical protein GX747_02800 [Tenericutes bacterium]|nr:hypothetical protein [Mycoplasmatota bacterium]
MKIIAIIIFYFSLVLFDFIPNIKKRTTKETIFYIVVYILTLCLDYMIITGDKFPDISQGISKIIKNIL